MKVRLTFVPPGGGEQDYMLDFELPSVPQAGDYISLTRPGTEGTADFIVRRTWWHLHYPSAAFSGDADKPIRGDVRSLVVECEYARGGFSSKGHLRMCDAYKHRGYEVPELQPSGY